MDLGRRKNGDRSTMSQINVTPLVDVMLVLLIIFMVTPPMMPQGMQVNLPKAEVKALPAPEESVVVTIERNCGQGSMVSLLAGEKKSFSQGRQGCPLW
jgi:biopolymer transport protein TolR